MLEQVATAFTNQDYKTAAKLLKVLIKESPEDLWVQFYVGRLQEVSGKHEGAEKIFKRVLRKSTNNKLTLQARQGLQRLEQHQQQQQKAAINTAKSSTGKDEPGILILEPISNEEKQTAAQKLAKIMQIDAYTARLQLPTRGWRCYRSGAIGELEYFGNALRSQGIPCFWVHFAGMTQIQVFQVDYFQVNSSLGDTPQATVICQSDRVQGSLSFNWSEITTKVTGLLPIFEQVVDVNLRRQLERKTQTQDYAEVYDLHLPQRNTILRICDRNYQFTKDQKISYQQHHTVRDRWKHLQQWLNQQTPQIPTYSEFNTFSQSIIDRTDILPKVEPHINLFRPQPSDWDNAFQIYSSAIMVRNN